MGGLLAFQWVGVCFFLHGEGPDFGKQGLFYPPDPPPCSAVAHSGTPKQNLIDFRRTILAHIAWKQKHFFPFVINIFVKNLSKDGKFPILCSKFGICEFQVSRPSPSITEFSFGLGSTLKSL